MIEESRQATEAYRTSLQNTGDAARVAASGQAGVGDQSAAAVPKLDSFAGATGRAADQLYRLADAQRKAAIEGLQAEKTAADSRLNALAARSPSGRSLARESNRAALRRGDILGVSLTPAFADLRNLFSGGRSDREIAKAIQETVADRDRAVARIAEIQSRPLESFIPPTGAAPQGAAGKAKTGGKGRAGPDPAREAERAREVQDRISAEIASAQIAYVQELSETTQSAAERAELERQAVDLTRQANEQDIKRDDRLNEAQRAELLAVNTRIAALRKQQIDQQESDRLRAQTLSIVSTALRDEDAMLQIQGRLATTIDERRRIELRRLAIAYDLEKAALAEELAAATIAKDMGRIAAAVRRMADLQDRKGADTELTLQENAGPLEQYRKRINDAGKMNEEFELIAVDGLQRLNDGLTDAIVNSENLGDVFKNVAKQIVADLIRIAIQQTVVNALLSAIGGGSGGGIGGGGLGGFLGKVFGQLFGRASGGYVGAGQMVRVNEGASPGRVEAFRPNGGGTIIPLGRMNAATPQAAGGGISTIRLELSGDIDARMVNVAQGVSVEVVRAAAPGIVKGASAQARYDMTRAKLG